MRVYLIGGLLFFNFLLLAQEHLPSNTSSVNPIGLNYFEKANKFQRTNPDSSIYYLELAIPFFKEGEDWEKLVSSYVAISQAYYIKRNISDFEKNLQKGYEIAQIHLSEDNQSFLNALEMVGLNLIIKEDYTKAIAIFTHLVDKCKNLNLDSQHGSALNNLAGCYFEQGQYQRSLDFFEQSYELQSQTLSENDINLVNFIVNIAFSHFHLNNYDTSIATLEKSKKILLANNLWDKSNYYTENVQYLLVKNYLQLRNYKKAKLYLNKIHHSERDSFEFNQKFKLLAQIANQEKDCEKAIKNAEIARRLTYRHYKHFKKHNRIAREIIELAEIQANCKHFSIALQLYQDALIQITSNFNNTSILQNPVIEDIPIKKDNYQFIIQQKASLLFQQYEQNNDIDYLKAALDTYILYGQFIAQIRQNYDLIGSEETLAKNILSAYEEAILIALMLYNKTEEPKYQAIAFTFAEGNKSIVLLESLRENLAKGYGGVPDSLIIKEKKKTLNINFYQKQLAIEQSKIEQNEEKIKQYKDQLFDLENRYQKLIENLEKNYPKYYQLKYDYSTPTLSKIQKNLTAQEQMIEYFIGEENLIIFSITKEKVAIQKYPLTEELNRAINLLLDLVKNGPTLQNQQANFSSFAETAHQLYLQLIAPVLDTKTNKLLIIPDDQLNYLPFELLLTSTEAKDEVLYANLPYLLKKIAINYHYSANLYERTKNTKQHQGTQPFVGFAPSFGQSMIAQTRNCIDDELYSLNCAQKELESIATQINGSQSIIGINATKDKFSKEAANGQILHLATHACINEQDPMLSKIYFADDYLTYYDLNNLALNADLAVLSACNTGSGKLEKGEGVMSIAKGFIQAGVPSVITSLWSVDDCATSDIMIQFYKYLKKGQTKDEALRNAKLKYLQTADKAHAHPFYWGAFVQFGNTDSLDYLSEEKPWTTFLLIGFVGLMLVILGRKIGV